MCIGNWWKALLNWLAPTIDEPGDRLDVRRAEPEDVGGIVSLLTAADRIEYAAGLAIRISSPMLGEKTCVGLAAGRIVAVMAYNVSPSTVDLHVLIVAPGVRDRGVGTQMLSLLAQFAHGEGKGLMATVESRDGDGIAWLRRRGLRPLRMCGGSPYIEEDDHRGEVRFFELPIDGSICDARVAR